MDAQALVLLLAAALLEEIVFRLGVHEFLLRRARAGHEAGWLGLPNIVTGLLFALLHILARHWIVALAAFPSALLIGVAYQHYRRLWPCVALHAALNLLWFATAPAVGPLLLR